MTQINITSASFIVIFIMHIYEGIRLENGYKKLKRSI